MSIADELEKAEHHLSIALSKMLPYAGTGKELASGKRWLGSWGEVKQAAGALLRVRALAERLRYLETPRERKPDVFAARSGGAKHDLQAAGIYHESGEANET